MQLTQSASMRMEQRQLLTPRMIQSMEILTLPLLALEERIEQELQNNPVLEVRDGGGEDREGAASAFDAGDDPEHGDPPAAAAGAGGADRAGASEQPGAGGPRRQRRRSGGSSVSF